MKHRPILMNGAMVRAVLEGRKTQTRRIVKKKNGPLFCDNCMGFFAVHDEGLKCPYCRATMHCPYGQPGDRLWVRETFADLSMPFGKSVRYRATDGEQFCHENDGAPIKWTPSIHMPRWASRITLEITGVRVERLNDISEHDAKAEGVEPADCCNAYYHGFSLLWESINGKGSWEDNPWVWVVEFKVVQP